MQPDDGTRYLFPGLGGVWSRADRFAYPVTRITAGAIFAVHGLARARLIDIGGPTIESTARYMAGFGIMPSLFWSYYITALELAGGILLILGLLTRPVAALFVAFMLVATFHVTARFGFWARDGGFEYSLILLAVAIMFLIKGGGPLSLDRALRREI